MNDTLTFTTTSFLAEKSSVLPPGVYSREFSSMLLASAVCTIAYMLSASAGDMPVAIDIALITAVFVISFLGSRRFIFHEHRLEAVLDKNAGLLEITIPGLLFRKRDKYPLENIQSIEVGSKSFVPDNIDGIKFVEKISAQHGSYVPGLGETEEFVTLSVKFKDGSEQMIFAGKTDDEPEIPLRDINNFLGINN